jgi:hypothetical protein
MKKFYSRSKYVSLADRGWSGDVIVLESVLESAPKGGRMKGRGKRVANNRKARSGV